RWREERCASVRGRSWWPPTPAYATGAPRPPRSLARSIHSHATLGEPRGGLLAIGADALGGVGVLGDRLLGEVDRTRLVDARGPQRAGEGVLRVAAVDGIDVVHRAQPQGALERRDRVGG